MTFIIENVKQATLPVVDPNKYEQSFNSDMYCMGDSPDLENCGGNMIGMLKLHTNVLAVDEILNCNPNINSA